MLDEATPVCPLCLNPLVHPDEIEQNLCRKCQWVEKEGDLYVNRP